MMHGQNNILLINSHLILADYFKTIKLIHNDIFSPNCYSDSVDIIANIKYGIKNACSKEHQRTDLYTFPATRRQVSLLKDIRQPGASMEGVGAAPGSRAPGEAIERKQ
jgi:hypothetical protein